MTVSPPAVGDVRVGAVRREATEDGHVPRLQQQRDGRRFVHRPGREFVIVAVARGQAAARVVARVDDGAAVVPVGRVERDEDGQEASP